MSNSLCFAQSVAGAVSSQNCSHDAYCVSVGSVRGGRIATVNFGKRPKCEGVARNELLGGRVGARGAHVGPGLGLGRAVSNGSKWSAVTWLDNKYEFLTLR